MNSSSILTEILIKNQRYYRIGEDYNKIYPSVTTVISSIIPKPFLVEWQRKMSLESFRKSVLNSSIQYITPGMI